MKINTSWQTKNIGDILKLEYGKPLPHSKRKFSGKYPVYGANGIKNYSDEFLYDKPSIVVGRKGSAGEIKLVEEKFWALDVTYYATFDEKKYDLKFLYNLLFTLDLPKLATGVKPGINRNNVYSINVNIPILSEQKRIVKILDEVFEGVERAKENVQRNLRNAREVFEGCLQSVFINPENAWEEKKLGEIYDTRDGTHDSPKYQKEGFALVTSKNLKQGMLTFDNIKYISKEDYTKINARSKVDKGDVLLAMIGTIGNPVVVDVVPNFAIKNVALFKIPKSQNSYFLKYYLDSKFVIEKMTKEANGTTQKFVGLGYLRNFKICLPSFSEQKSIVAKLDELSTQTKNLELIYQQKLTNLEELKKSILKKAFNGEL